MRIFTASVLGALVGGLIAPAAALSEEPPYVIGQTYVEAETTFNCVAFSDAKIIAALIDAQVEVEVFLKAINASSCFEVAGMTHIPEREKPADLKLLHILETYQLADGKKSAVSHFLITERGLVGSSN